MVVTSQHLLEIAVSSLLLIIVWNYLGRKVFKAYFEALENREEQTVGVERSRKKLELEAEELSQKLNSRLNSSRMQGLKLRDKLVNEAKEQAASLIESARTKSEKEVSSGLQNLSRERERALLDVSSESERIAGFIVEEVLKASERSSALH